MGKKKHIIGTFSYPISKVPVMERVEKSAADQQISVSKQIFNILESWANTNIPVPQSEEPQATRMEPPKVMAPKEELEAYLSQLSIEELASMQALGFTVNQIAKEKWKEKKHSAIPKKKSFLEEISAVVGTRPNGAEV